MAVLRENLSPTGGRRAGRNDRVPVNGRPRRGIATPGTLAAGQEAARSEPALATDPLWIGFDDADGRDPEPIPPKLEAPLLIGFDNPQESGLNRAIDFGEVPLESCGNAASSAMAASLVLHILFLTLLLNWSWVAGEPAIAVPVQLIIEESPLLPGPELAPDAPKRLATGSGGENLAAPKERADSPVPVTAPATPVPMPVAVPKPAAPLTNVVAKPAARRQEAIRRHVAGEGAPAATRDEYFTQLVKLTRRHLDLLPMSVVGDRRGETIVKLLVHADGTITRIAVAQGSGYRDIDARILRIVAAVHRFPPLPQGFGSRGLALQLRFRFPDALLER